MCSWHHLSVIDYVVCLNADVGDAVMFVFWFYLWANPSEKIMFPWNHLNAWQIPGIRYFLQKFRAGLVYSVFVYLGRFQKRWRIVIFLYISVQCQWQIQGLSLCIAMALVSFEVRNQNQNFLFFQGRSMCWLNILRMHCKKVYTVPVQWGTVTCLSGVGGEYMDFKQLVITLSQSLFLQPTIELKRGKRIKHLSVQLVFCFKENTCPWRPSLVLFSSSKYAKNAKRT